MHVDKRIRITEMTAYSEILADIPVTSAGKSREVYLNDPLSTLEIFYFNTQVPAGVNVFIDKH